VECVGIADRSAFDLTAHSEETKQPLSAFVEFSDGSRTVDTLTFTLNKPLIGQTFKAKGQAQKLISYLEGLDFKAATGLEQSLKQGPVKVVVGTEEFQVVPEMVKESKKGTKNITGEQITPGVIEPSFGIGRILYSLLEHAYYCREGDEQRSVLALPPAIAPVKVSVLPLISNPQLAAFIPKITAALNELGISSKVDDIGQTIGRRYARTDEIGIPFGITIDFDTVKDETLTLRERDSTAQVRVHFNEIATIIKRLVDGRIMWADVWSKYPHVEAKKE
jgi:glycyl-tRNA synthetase